MNLGYTPPVQNRGPGQCLQCSDSSVHARLSHRLPTRLSLCISLCETLVPSPSPSGSSGSPRGGQATASLTLRSPHVPTRRRLQGAVPPTASLGGRFLLPCRSGASSSRAPRAPRSLPPVRLSLPEAPSCPLVQGPLKQGYFSVRGRLPSFSNGSQAPGAP